MHLVQQRMFLLVLSLPLLLYSRIVFCAWGTYLLLSTSCRLFSLLNFNLTYFQRSVLRACKSARYFHSGEITSSIAFKLYSKFILMVIITGVGVQFNTFTLLHLSIFSSSYKLSFSLSLFSLSQLSHQSWYFISLLIKLFSTLTTYISHFSI